MDNTIWWIIGAAVVILLLLLLVARLRKRTPQEDLSPGRRVGQDDRADAGRRPDVPAPAATSGPTGQQPPAAVPASDAAAFAGPAAGAGPLRDEAPGTGAPADGDARGEEVVVVESEAVTDDDGRTTAEQDQPGWDVPVEPDSGPGDVPAGTAVTDAPRQESVGDTETDALVAQDPDREFFGADDDVRSPDTTPARPAEAQAETNEPEPGADAVNAFGDPPAEDEGAQGRTQSTHDPDAVVVVDQEAVSIDADPADSPDGPQSDAVLATAVVAEGDATRPGSTDAWERDPIEPVGTVEIDPAQTPAGADSPTASAPADNTPADNTPGDSASWPGSRLDPQQPIDPVAQPAPEPAAPTQGEPATAEAPAGGDRDGLDDRGDRHDPDDRDEVEVVDAVVVDPIAPPEPLDPAQPAGPRVPRTPGTETPNEGGADPSTSGSPLDRLNEVRQRVQGEVSERWVRPDSSGEAPKDKVEKLRDRVEGDVREGIKRFRNRGGSGN